MGIKTISKNVIKKEILVYSLGYLNAIKYNVIHLDYKYHDENINKTVGIMDSFFKIALIEWLEKNNFEQDFIDLIYRILELEDILLIVPNQFHQELDNIIENIINELKEFPMHIKSSKSLCLDGLKNISFT